METACAKALRQAYRNSDKVAGVARAKQGIQAVCLLV